jgi:hypothetical protein
LNLTAGIINRLIALKSLLDLGDIELLTVAVSRLESECREKEVAPVLGLLKDHRYAEAAGLINKLLSEGTRLARWIDPEIALLEVELERVTADLADLETEQAELEHLVSRFQTAHNEALGERLASLLKLRMRMLERQVQTHPEKQTDYDQASRDFDEFQRNQEIQEETDARTKWELTGEEQKELKRLFRQGSKMCHPDLVPAEHHDSAAQMFRDLRKAYDEGDLARVRQIQKSAEAGSFQATDNASESDDRRKARLIGRITGIREALERTRTHVDGIKHSSTYQTMTQHPDWSGLFDHQTKLLDQEIENLTLALKEMENDDA